MKDEFISRKTVVETHDTEEQEHLEERTLKEDYFSRNLSESLDGDDQRDEADVALQELNSVMKLECEDHSNSEVAEFTNTCVSDVANSRLHDVTSPRLSDLSLPGGMGQQLVATGQLMPTSSPRKRISDGESFARKAKRRCRVSDQDNHGSFSSRGEVDIFAADIANDLRKIKNPVLLMQAKSKIRRITEEFVLAELQSTSTTTTSGVAAFSSPDWI